MADWSFTITHFPNSNNTGTYITDFVISIPMFTDTGSGEVNEATIILDAKDGQFIRANINGRTKISQYDRIRIEANDGNVATSNTDPGTQRGYYDKYFYVMKKQPIKSKDEGVRLQLELLGTESFLQRVMYIKPHFFETPWNVLKDIGDLYNDNRGSASTSIMPNLTGHDNALYNKLPTSIVNSYDYGVNEDTCFDRMSDVIDSMGASLSAGGVLNFFDLRFTYSNNGRTLTASAFSSGNAQLDSAGVPTGKIGAYPIVTIDNSTSVNVGETDGGIDAKTGNQVLAWGAAEGGSLPTDWSRFAARQQFLNLGFPEWEAPPVTYGEYSKVSYDADDGNGRVNYVAGSATNTSVAPPGSGGTAWNVLTHADYYGDEIQYSPWTVGKATSVFRNGGGDPTVSYGLAAGSARAASNEPRPMFWDHSFVINDGYFWRTWANVRSTSDGTGTPFTDIPPECFYDTDESGAGDEAGVYRGFRVLCDGNPTPGVDNLYFGYNKDIDGVVQTSGATVVDRNGKLLKDSVLQYDGSEWFVFARPYSNQFAAPSASGNDPKRLQVVVLQEARIYRFYKDESNETWQNQSDDDMGIDCLHPVYKDGSNYKIENVPGFLANYADNAEDSSVSVKDVNDSDGPYSNDSGNGPPWDTTNANSAVEVVYQWGGPLEIRERDATAGLRLNGRNYLDFYSTGAWISLMFPSPLTSFNSISEEVGDLYGGGTNTDNPKEPATVDGQNMHFTHDGKRGFNQTTSEDFGQINSIGFMIKLKYEQKTDAIPFFNTFKNIYGEDGANFKMRCVLIDTDDNMVYQDFDIKFNDFWEPKTLPLSGFEIFKAREPRYETSAVYYFKQLKGIDIQNIFIWRNIKGISIFTLDPYDESGRYSPMAGRYCNGLGVVTDDKRKVTLTLDGLRFIKPLLAATDVIDKELIESDFLEKPDIGNYEQLKSDAYAEQQKHLFQRVEYDVTTTGMFDVGFGDFFNLADSEMIPAFTDPTESAGQVKLVAKRIEYSISKPLNGKGGFLRRIRGVRRFT